MVGFHNKPSLTPRPSSRPACCATCRHARLRLRPPRGLSGPRGVRVANAGLGVFGIRRWPALPEITQGTSASDAGRTAPASADIGEFRFTDSVLAGHRRRRAAWAIYAARTPNGTPRHAPVPPGAWKSSLDLPGTERAAVSAAVQLRWPKSENPHFSL